MPTPLDALNVNASKRRSPKLARWLAALYLLWSLLVFFGSLGSESHSWWPIFLYPIIWPISAVYEKLSSYISNWLIPDAHHAPNWVWTVNDYAAGAFYILVGTIWMWFLGHILSKGTRRYLR